MYLPSSQAPYGPELVDVLIRFSNYIFFFFFFLVYWRKICYQILKNQVENPWNERKWKD